MFRKFILAIFVISNAFADNTPIVDPSTNSLDEFIDSKIVPINAEEIDNNLIDELTIFINEQKDNAHIPLREREKSLPDYTPEKFRAVLVKDAVIVRLKDQKAFKNKKDFNLWALEQRKKGAVTYILDKAGKKKFITYSKNLLHLEPELNLYPKEDFTKKYHPHKKLEIQNNEFKFIHNLTYQWRNYSLSEISNTVGSDDSKGSANSINWMSFYNTYLKLNLGLQASYESGNLNNVNQSLDGNWKSFAIGPILKYQINTSDKWGFNFLLGIQRSFFHSLKTDNATFSLDETKTNFSIETQYAIGYADLLFGFNYSIGKITWDSVESDNPDLFNFASSKSNIKAFAFYMGYQFRSSIWFD